MTKIPPKPVNPSVHCDVCGRNCQEPGYVDTEYAEIKATWGYDSRKDLTYHEIQICEGCFDHVLQFLKERATFYGKLDFDSQLHGRSYAP